MTKPNSKKINRRLGREQFAQISAVEGLGLTFLAAEEFQADEAQQVDPAERRRRIIKKYIKRNPSSDV